jgi:hypothetical protein
MINTKLHNKALRKNYNTGEAAATAQAAMWRRGVLLISEDSATDVSSEEALGTTVGFK